MIWLALKLAVGAVGVALVLYGVYIDGQRQRARKQRLLHTRS